MHNASLLCPCYVTVLTEWHHVKHPLMPYLERIHVQQLVLECATERAGTLLTFAGKELGLGVVNPRTETIESPETVRAAITQALQLSPVDWVFLNPDCGFGIFSNRPVNGSEIAFKKLKAIVEAVRA